MAVVHRNPDCLWPLFPKSRRLPFSGFLPLDVSSPALGDILRSGHCRGSQRTHLQRPLLRMSPRAVDETSNGGNPENGRRRDSGRRGHRQSGFQCTYRPWPSSLFFSTQLCNTVCNYTALKTLPGRHWRDECKVPYCNIYFKIIMILSLYEWNGRN